MASPIEAWVRKNRVVAAGAAVGAGVIGFAFLRDRGATPAPAAASPAAGAVATPAAAAAADLSAYSAGAAAAAMGLETGAALGAGALGLAASVTGSLADVAGTLADSQAAVAGSATGALADALAQSLAQPVTQPAPAPSPTPEPTPTPTPTPTPLPPTQVMCNAALGKRPSGAWGWVRASAGTWRELYKGTDGLWRGRDRSASTSWSAWVGPPLYVRTATGGQATALRIMSGSAAGRYTHRAASENPMSYQCPSGSA